MWKLGKDVGTITAPRFFPCVLLLFMLNRSCFSIGGDTLSSGRSLSVSQTLVSQRNIFELGFFKKGTSLSIFLGIWYKRFDDQIVVWVANREQSLSDPSSLQLELSGDGNLVLKNGSRVTWSTDFKPLPSNSTEAVLLDDGNFVVRDVSDPSTIHWQSFDYPTDTWLPGAKLGINKLTGETQVLTSWKSSEDPAPGMFSVGIDPNQTSQYFIEWNKSVRYWGSGLWNGERFSSIPEMRLNYIFNFSFVSNERESYFTYSIYNIYNDILSRLVMERSGQVRQQTWLAGVWDWAVFWSQPREQSQVYAFCGAFGIFRENLSTPCVCLQGFEPFSIEAAKLNDWSGGCVRRAPLQCQNSSYVSGINDRFLTISNMQLPANSKAFHSRSFEECESACMQNCSCTAYAYNESGCLVWEGALLNLQQLLNGSNTKQSFYLKLAASEFQNAGGNSKKLWIITAVLVPVIVLVAGGFICCLCRRKLKQKGENNSSEDLLLFDFSASGNTAAETNIGNNLTTGGKKDVELPMFSFVSVSAATDNFSVANKLGEGGFGPVYKGKLLKGQEIAVKRLSKRSGQGFQEFKNEALVIARLQHRNLVRLLGCCSERDEYILIYEYMPNRSLDFYLFDPKKQEILDWSTRIRIIEGIAQGLLYLHQYSRLRIIHRDLKASNILLDNEMNPKISDFGMARIFGDNESQANTNRIVGTYGYMSPEYALEGLFSIKSDVFSFGVLMLEIVSGKKNTSFYHSDSLNLLGYAWGLWNADRGLELMDPLLGHPSSASALLRLINIGLLCVQGNPTDRPTMSDVVSMLGNEYAPLPTPKQPAFSTTGMTITNSSLGCARNCSVNNVTMSLIEAR